MASYRNPKRKSAPTASQIPVANRNLGDRFPALYAKTDSETQNEKSSGETLQGDGDRQGFTWPRWPSALPGVEKCQAQASPR
jgi:hypothetical protein